MDIPKYKTALIVGAGGGISASLARLFAKQGLRIALAARHIEKLGALCSETGARAFACNAADADEVERLFGAVEREFGRAGCGGLQRQRAGARRVCRSGAGGCGAGHRHQRVRRIPGGAAGGAPHAARQARRDPVHRRVRQRQGLPAIRTLRDGQVRAARPGAKHGARIVAAGHSRRTFRDRRRHPQRRCAPSPRTGRTRCSIPMRLR